MTITIFFVKLLLVALAIGCTVGALTNWRPFHRSMPSKRLPSAPAPTKVMASNIPPPPVQSQRRRPTLIQPEATAPGSAAPASSPRSDTPIEAFDVAAFGRELDTLRRRMDHTTLSNFEQAATARHDQHDADAGQDLGHVSSYLNDALTSAVRLLRRDQRASDHRGTTALIESSAHGRYLKHSS
jgi:hypothetical protein